MHAARLSGTQVLAALDDASSRVYFAGVDHAFASLQRPLTPETVGAHDIGWLTVFACALDAARRTRRFRAKPRQRSPQRAKRVAKRVRR